MSNPITSPISLNWAQRGGGRRQGHQHGRDGGRRSAGAARLRGASRQLSGVDEVSLVNKFFTFCPVPINQLGKYGIIMASCCTY